MSEFFTCSHSEAKLFSWTETFKTWTFSRGTCGLARDPVAYWRDPDEATSVRKKVFCRLKHRFPEEREDCEDSMTMKVSKVVNVDE